MWIFERLTLVETCLIAALVATAVQVVWFELCDSIRQRRERKADEARWARLRKGH